MTTTKSDTTQTPRQQARAIASALSGQTPRELLCTVADLIEIAIEDSATEAKRELDDLWKRLGEQWATTDRVRVERSEAMGRAADLKCQLRTAEKERDEARAEVERLQREADDIDRTLEMAEIPCCDQEGDEADRYTRSDRVDMLHDDREAGVGLLEIAKEEAKAMRLEVERLREQLVKANIALVKEATNHE